MPDGSASMMSMSGLSIAMSDVDSNYDTVSISRSSKMSSVDYGRQKKKDHDYRHDLLGEAMKAGKFPRKKPLQKTLAKIGQ